MTAPKHTIGMTLSRVLLLAIVLLLNLSACASPYEAPDLARSAGATAVSQAGVPTLTPTTPRTILDLPLNRVWAVSAREHCFGGVTPIDISPLEAQECYDKMSGLGYAYDDPEFIAGITLFSQYPQIMPGVVSGTGSGTSIWAIQQALAQGPGTIILYHAETARYIFGAPLASGHYWYGVVRANGSLLSTLEQTTQCGNACNVETWGEFLRWLKGNGWEAVDKTAVPLAFSKVFQLGLSWLVRTSSYMNDFFIVVLPIDNMQEFYLCPKCYPLSPDGTIDVPQT